MPASSNADPLMTTARCAAEELVARLRWAQRQTDAWTQPELTDALVDAALAACVVRLTGTGCWGEANRSPSNLLWEIAGPLLRTGSLQVQAREKPRGYAGDYDLLAKICARWCCADPLGRAFDRFFQRQAAPQAVRARTAYAAALMAERCLRLAEQDRPCCLISVGAGPALDVHGALSLIEPTRRSCTVHLLDLDPEALDYARRQLEPLVTPQSLVVRRENLFRLAQRPDLAASLERPDFLVCSGLFDYLADEPATALLALFWQRLTPGGQLLVGNFAPHNPTRAYMEWIGNWYLRYRTPRQMHELAQQAGIPADRFTVAAERTGTDLLLLAQKEE